MISCSVSDTISRTWRDVPPRAHAGQVRAHALDLVVVGAGEREHELGVGAAQHGAAVDQPALVERPAEREHARLGDDRLVQIEERRGAAGGADATLRGYGSAPPPGRGAPRWVSSPPSTGRRVVHRSAPATAARCARAGCARLADMQRPVIGVVGGSGGVGASSFAAVLASRPAPRVGARRPRRRAAAGSTCCSVSRRRRARGGRGCSWPVAPSTRRRCSTGCRAGAACPVLAADVPAVDPGGGACRCSTRRPRPRRAGGARPAAGCRAPNAPRRCCAATSSCVLARADVAGAGRPRTRACRRAARAPGRASSSAPGRDRRPAEAAALRRRAAARHAAGARARRSPPARLPRRLPRPALPGGDRCARRRCARAVPAMTASRPRRPRPAPAGRRAGSGRPRRGGAGRVRRHRRRRGVRRAAARRRGRAARRRPARAAARAARRHRRARQRPGRGVARPRAAGMERADVRFADDAAVRRLAQRLAAAAGRRLDDALPFADAVLPDGTRLHAVLPPLAGAPRPVAAGAGAAPLDLAALVARGGDAGAAGRPAARGRRGPAGLRRHRRHRHAARPRCSARCSARSPATRADPGHRGRRRSS